MSQLSTLPAGLAPEHTIKVLDLHMVLEAGRTFECLGAIGTLLREGSALLIIRVSVEVLCALVKFQCLD